MKKEKEVLFTLLATVCTFPCSASSLENNVAQNDSPKTITQHSEREIISLTRNEKNKSVIQCSINGKPGMYYKILFSKSTGAPFEQTPVAEGQLGNTGVSIVDIEFDKYNSPNIYIKVLTSTVAEFSKNVRVSELLEIFKDKAGDILTNCSGNKCIDPSKSTTTKAAKSRGHSSPWYSRE